MTILQFDKKKYVESMNPTTFVKLKIFLNYNIRRTLFQMWANNCNNPTIMSYDHKLDHPNFFVRRFEPACPKELIPSQKELLL